MDPKGITLWLDLNGNVTETSGSNFVIVRNGAVVAPPFRNTLPGISLLTVQELCSKLRIPFEQTDFKVYDVMNASEAMLTSTPYCLAPVTRINGARIGNGEEVGGPVFRLSGSGVERARGTEHSGSVPGRRIIRANPTWPLPGGPT